MKHSSSLVQALWYSGPLEENRLLDEDKEAGCPMRLTLGPTPVPQLVGEAGRHLLDRRESSAFGCGLVLDPRQQSN